MATFDCNTNTRQLSQLVDLLESDSSIVLTGVDAVVETVNSIADELNPIDVVEDAIGNVDNNVDSVIIDYTRRANNSGRALEKFDQDFEDFQTILKECMQTKSLDFVKRLSLGIPLPKLIDPTDLINIGSSQLREAIGNIIEFPLPYLSSIKDTILDEFSAGINGLAGGIYEFYTANDLDDVEQFLKENIGAVAKEIDMLVNCAIKMQCLTDDVLRDIERYERAMTQLPMDPTFQLNTTEDFVRTPDYNLDSNDVLSQTIATPIQIQNMNNSKTSYTKAMKLARSVTSKF